MAWELGQKLGWSGKSGSVGAVLSSSGSFLGEVAPTRSCFGAVAARDALAKWLLSEAWYEVRALVLFG